ncbi:MAG: hypothetical protein H6965_03310 [Chromatiaceae bacterium]|nr:hypothetical protein [Chromatiaceae bacterium]
MVEIERTSTRQYGSGLSLPEPEFNDPHKPLSDARIVGRINGQSLVNNATDTNMGREEKLPEN